MFAWVKSIFSKKNKSKKSLPPELAALSSSQSVKNKPIIGTKKPVVMVSSAPRTAISKRRESAMNNIQEQDVFSRGFSIGFVSGSLTNSEDKVEVADQVVFNGGEFGGGGSSGDWGNAETSNPCECSGSCDN